MDTTDCTDTGNPACTCVFSTYELLEWTLLHLPLRDLLLAERVCKTWLQLIQKSGKIGQALFRRPSRPEVNLYIPGLTKDGMKELLANQTPPAQPSCFLNPFRNRFVENGKGDILSPPVQISHALINAEGDQAASTAFYHDDASWRRMLLLQPLPKYL